MNRSFVLFGLLAVGLAVGGCAQNMAKGNGAAPSDTEMAAADDAAAPAANARDAAAGDSLPTPMADADANAAATDTGAGEEAAPADGHEDAIVAKADEDAKAKQQAAALLPLPPEAITSTIKQLTRHPRVRYLSRTAQYDYYVGGRLEAKYDVNKHQLIVTGADDQVTCEYSKDGKMISGDRAMPPKVVDTCNALINELGDYLSR